MKHFIVFTVILFLLGDFVFAQSQFIATTPESFDSLLAEVPKMKEDTNGVRLLNRIADYYATDLPDEGLKWGTKGLTLAQRIGWLEGQAASFNTIGCNYMNKDDYVSALDVLLKALTIYEQTVNVQGIGDACRDLGILYECTKDYDQSLVYYFRSLQAFERLGQSKSVLVVLNNINITYWRQHKYKEALEYSYKALHIVEVNKYPTIAKGYVLSTLAYIQSDLKDNSAALASSVNALSIGEEWGDKYLESSANCTVGDIYYRIAADSMLPKPNSLVFASREANLAKGIYYLKKGISQSKAFNFRRRAADYIEILSKALFLQGDYRGALSAFNESVQLRDSLFNIANTEKLNNLETKRMVELKNKDIVIQHLEFANKRDERFFFIGGMGFLLVLMSVLFRSYKRQQKGNKLLSKEKKRSDDLLLNILPSEVAEQLKETGEAHAQHFDDVSVLYTDFVDFTQIGEALTPKVLVKELHECFSAFDAIMERHGLEKIKTVGDAYIAVCGVPVADARHAHKCVGAALEILEFIEDRKKRERTFEIRIGINSGPVVAGIVGTKKFAYDIWGDTVNTAARMEQHGMPGRINISQSTFELVRDEFICNSRGRIAAKHKGEIDMYFIEVEAVEV